MMGTVGVGELGYQMPILVPFAIVFLQTPSTPHIQTLHIARKCRSLRYYEALPDT